LLEQYLSASVESLYRAADYTVSPARNFDAFYIFYTIKFLKSLARNFQTFQSGWSVAKPAVMQVMQCMTKNFPQNV
jgi:hypothetical protein